MENIRNLVSNTLVPHTNFVEAVKRIGQCYKSVDGSAEPICIPVIGESGTGKSRLLEHFENVHQRYRVDSGLKIPILRVRTPSKPTVKGLAETLLQKMEEPLYASGSEQVKTNRLIALLHHAGTQLVMIDDFQHFFDKTTQKVWHHVADWLKTVVDESHVALVVSGLETCRYVIDQNEQLARRFLAPVWMRRLDWTSETDQGEFMAILACFQKALSPHFDMPVLDDEEMAFRWFCASGGLIGYMTKILRQAVWDALDAETNVITLGGFESAHAQAVWTPEWFSGAASPFSTSFKVEPNEQLLSNVRRIGTRVDPETTAQPRRVMPKAKRVNVSQVLTAT